MAATNDLQSSIIIIAVVMAVVVALIGWLFAKSISRPISNIARIAQDISIGDIQHEIEVNSKDEIGILAGSFKKLITYMQELAGASEAIANNDLTVQIEPKSEKDVLGNSFKTMTTNEYIRGVKGTGWEPFPGKLWQRSYYDHIIRDDDKLNLARRYVIGNPTQWPKDKYNV